MKLKVYITIIALSLSWGLELGLFTGLAAVPASSKPAPRSALSFWADGYIKAKDPAAKQRMLAEGVRLATQRRVDLTSLIRSNPRQAFADVLSVEVQRSLPGEVAAQLETRVSGIGDLEVVCAFPSETSRVELSLQRNVRLNGVTYSAHVYGRRLYQAARHSVPLRGVVVDGIMALDEAVLHELGPGELPDASQDTIDLRHLVTTQSSAKSVFAEAGGKVFQFASHEELRQAEAQLEALEDGNEPASNDALTSALKHHLGYQNPVTPKIRQNAAIGSVSPQVIRVLVIRVDFLDFPGLPVMWTTPYDEAYCQDLMDNTVKPFFLRSSYGAVVLTNTVSPRLYRMPSPGSAYIPQLAYRNGDLLVQDARREASQDYDLGQFDRVIVVFRELGLHWAGLADIPGDWVLVNWDMRFRVVAHELGHTLGLYHAGLWQSYDGDPVSNSGTFTEYGDPFDPMGSNFANDTRTDFNPRSKRQLNWIDDTRVRTVTESGIYRVGRIDGLATSGIVGLRVAKDWETSYWITCRRNFSNLDDLIRHGACIIWGEDSPYFSYLVDPLTSDGNPGDASLPVDRALIDIRANLTIATVAEGGDPGDEYVDMQISFGPPPRILNQPVAATVLPGQGASFTVQAQGSAAIVYQWQRKVNGTSSWVSLSDDNTYSGSQANVLVVSGDTQTLAGDEFRCVLTNALGGFNVTQPSVLNVIPSGVSTLAGVAGVSGNDDGAGEVAHFTSPCGLAVSPTGELIIADQGNAALRKIDASGLVSTLAIGNRDLAGANNSTTNPQSDHPTALTIDAMGNIYVADQSSHTVRRISPSGVVTTLAVTTAQPGQATGPINPPTGIAVDAATNIFLADTGNHVILRISPAGDVVALAGVTGSAGSADGVGQAVRFDSPAGLAVDRFGNLYIADSGNSTIRRMTPDGSVTTLAGQAYNPGSVDGVGTNAQFNLPTGIAVDPAGNLFVADHNNSAIRKITRDGIVTTLAGMAGMNGSADGPFDSARFAYPTAIALDPVGTLYVADTDNHTIRMLRANAFADLQITSLGNQVMVSWPTGDGNSVLESANDFAAPAWNPVSDTVRLCSGYSIATIDANASSAFFRLHR